MYTHSCELTEHFLQNKRHSFERDVRIIVIERPFLRVLYKHCLGHIFYIKGI